MNVYEIVDGNNIPIYVGITKSIKRRMSEHKREIGKSKYYLYRKLKIMVNEGYIFNYNVLFENLSLDEANLKEIELIKKYKEQGIKLCNLSEGGGGRLGFSPVFTDEWKNNLKAAAKEKVMNGWKPANYQKKLEDVVGINRANEIKSKSSNVHKGKLGLFKGKKCEEITTPEKVKEWKERGSKNALKNFVGKKQTEEQIKKRMESTRLFKLFNYDSVQKIRAKSYNNGIITSNKKSITYKFTNNEGIEILYTGSASDTLNFMSNYFTNNFFKFNILVLPKKDQIIYSKKLQMKIERV